MEDLKMGRNSIGDGAQGKSQRSTASKKFLENVRASQRAEGGRLADRGAKPNEGRLAAGGDLLLGKVTSQTAPALKASLGLALPQKEPSTLLGDRGSAQSGSKAASPSPGRRSSPAGK
jgi:hypothetical protein